jgi:hypothetical protein
MLQSAADEGADQWQARTNAETRAGVNGGQINSGFVDGISYGGDGGAGETDRVLMLANQLQNASPGALMAAFNLMEKERKVPVPQFEAGVMSGGALYAPTADAGLSGKLGPMLRDANGQQLMTPDQISNQAAQVRASKGFDFNEKTPDQIQAQMMTGMSKSIMNLPPDQQHLAYERGIGVLMGKGVVNFNEAPPWDQGGRELVKHIAELEAQTKLGVASLNAQGQVGAAREGAQGQLDASRIQAQGRLGEAQAQANAEMMKTAAGAPMREAMVGKTQAEAEKARAEALSISRGGNSKLAEKLAGTDASMYKDANDAIDVAASIRSNLNNIKEANMAGSEGTLSSIGNKALGSLGVNTDTVVANKQIEQASNALALQLKSLYKMTGAMSDNDVNLLKAMTPKLEDTRESRAAAIENLGKFTDYVTQRSTAMQNYIQSNGTSKGFNTEWQKQYPNGAQTYIEQTVSEKNQPTPHGLTDEQWKKIQEMRGAGAPVGGGGAVRG